MILKELATLPKMLAELEHICARLERLELRLEQWDGARRRAEKWLMDHAEYPERVEEPNHA